MDGENVQLHPALKDFDLIGRPVYIGFDGDFRSRESVLQGLVRTYCLFTFAGAVVRVVQWDEQFKGLDDFIAAKAGLDLEKQKSEIDVLEITVSESTSKKAAKTWIIPQYRCLFEREIAAIQPGQAERNMLADQVHEALGTSPGDLKRSWRETSKPPSDGPVPTIIVETELEPWPEPIVPAELAQRLLDRWGKHLITSDANLWTLVLWETVTYFVDHLSLMPILGLVSAVKRCGKTTTLQVPRRTAWKSLLAASVSPAATFRTIEKYEPCFLIDEFDAFLSQNEEFRGILNTCHTRGIVHVRCNPTTLEPEGFNAFCPVALALIGDLPSTVEDRAILIRLERKQVSEKVVPVRKVPAEEFLIDRRMLRRFAIDYGKEFLEAIPVLPNIPNDRALENWESLAQMAQVFGELWPKRAFLAAKLLTPSDSEEQSFEIQLLFYLRLIFQEKALSVQGREEEIFHTGEILSRLNLEKEAPWADRKQFSLGLTYQKMVPTLRKKFRVRTVKSKTTQLHGYRWKDLVEIFKRYLGEDGSPPPPPPPPPPPSSPPSGGGEPENPKAEKNSQEPSENCGAVEVFQDKSFSDKELTAISTASKNSTVQNLFQAVEIPSIHSDTTSFEEKPPSFHSFQGSPGIFLESIPPSTPQADFCTPSHPELFVFLDLETFHPYEGDYPQPLDKTAAQLLRKKNKGEAHPWAKDPRRCVLRFLTIHDTEGTFGPEPLTIDFQANPELPANVLDALANRTIVAHNADFDLSVLRRYGISVSSSIIDTMIASRLLGLGKEKFKVPDTACCDLSDEELDELTSSQMDDINPTDHDLAATVRRYLGIKMEKAHTKLGGSDWGRSDLSSDHFVYIVEDVAYLPALREALEAELKEANLDEVFRERMEFFPHLNQIKMTGNPVDPLLCEADHRQVTAEKEAIREELRAMFADYRAPIPKSRLKTVKIEVADGKFKRVPGPIDEEFSPSNPDHVRGALAHRGIDVENLQEATLRKAGSPECRLLLKYGTAKKRLNAIKAILRSTFSDGRVRARGWNQLAARTGRIISSEPNLQQVPKNWRTAFRVDPPLLWLKPDLSMIEVVILAVVTQDSGLIDLLRRGEDVYVLVASRLFNVKPIRKEKEEEEGCVTEDLRDQTKPVVLGTNYGLTIWGLCRRFREEFGKELSLEEARGFFDTFFGMFPGVAEYHTRAAEDALTLDYVRTAGGQRRWLPPLLESDQEDHYWPSFERRKKILMNTPIQGGQADLQIKAVNKFMPRLPAGVEVVNLVHDEVDAIVTRETLQPTVEVIRCAFQEAFAELYGDVLIPQIKFSVGQNWGELQELKLSK